MNRRILLPYGAKKKLRDEFKIARPTLDKMILGGNVIDTETKQRVRERALELGGVQLNN